MMSDTVYERTYTIQGGDFINAGESSCDVRNILKDIGIDPDIIRRVAIAAGYSERT